VPFPLARSPRKSEEVVCTKVWLKPGSEDRVYVWANYLQAYRAEASRSLENEGVVIGSMFFDSNAGQPYFIFYRRCASEAQAVAVVKRSVLAIDFYHQSFKRNNWTRVEQLELLVDLYSK